MTKPKFRVIKEWCHPSSRYKYYPEKKLFGLFWVRYNDPKYYTIKKRFDTCQEAEQFIQEGGRILTPISSVVWTDLDNS